MNVPPTHGLGRHRLLAATAVLVTSAVLTACGGSGSGGDAGATAASPAALIGDRQGDDDADHVDVLDPGSRTSAKRSPSSRRSTRP